MLGGRQHRPRHGSVRRRGETLKLEEKSVLLRVAEIVYNVLEIRLFASRQGQVPLLLNAAMNLRVGFMLAFRRPIQIELRRVL
jgi:hypothetical protein